MNVILTETDLDIALQAGDSYHEILDHVTYLLFEKALVKARGNKSKAAKILKINRGTLNVILKRVEAKKEARNATSN
ncbi:helix-turn-helix domain-containing protein [Acinetobacter baumannii]|uniref:helix-turn-helix domain-containing protein n=1 Tax=Acinetobacter baumannii TaxID=470 RepID=UPI003858B9BD